MLPVEALREGDEYEVVVTTAGGLWRYRLGDRVCVTDWAEKTPSLRFLGRSGNVSDRFGEKLSEPFVAEALDKVFGCETPRFAMLAPDEDHAGCRYTLYVEGMARAHWAESLDHELRRNPHYAYCRDIGQLIPVGLFVIAERGRHPEEQLHVRLGWRATVQDTVLMDVGQKLTLTCGVVSFHSRFSFQGAVEDGGEHGSQLDGGFGLQALHFLSSFVGNSKS